MRIETAAEACAALAVMIVGADEVGTDEERRFLFDTVAALPIFGGLDQAQFRALMADAADEVYSSFHREGNRLSDAGVGDLARQICEALPRELRVEALEAAVGLARADGISTEEVLMLQRLCDELEIDAELASRLLGPSV